MKIGFKNTMVAFAFAVPAMTACSSEAPQPEPDKVVTPSEAEGTVTPKFGGVNCNCSGVLTCPTNALIEVEYAPPNCGSLTHLQAQSSCKSRCGGRTCTDSGWTCI